MFHLFGVDQVEGFAEFRRLLGRRRRSFRLNECKGLIDLVHEYDPVLTPERADDLAYHEAVLAADLRRWERAEELFGGLLERDSLTPELRVKVYDRGHCGIFTSRLQTAGRL